MSTKSMKVDGETPLSTSYSHNGWKVTLDYNYWGMKTWRATKDGYPPQSGWDHYRLFIHNDLDLTEPSEHD